MIYFAEELGVMQINFHDLFKVGIPMDTWTGNFAPSPKDWMPVYNEISEKIRLGIRSFRPPSAMFCDKIGVCAQPRVLRVLPR